VLGRFAGAGWIGVDLFFVLSGFLITGILLDSKGRPGYYRSFYARRALRILPLYYGLLAVILLLPRSGALAAALGAPYLAEHQGWFWSHTVNWLMVTEGESQFAVRNGFGGIWSLSIEEQFYLLWPLVVAVTSRKGLGRLAVALAVLAFVLRMALSLRGTPDVVLYSATPTRIDPLAIGALLAVLAREGGLEAHRTRYSVAVICSAAAFGLLAVISQRMPNANALTFAGVASALAVGWGAVLILTTGEAGRWVALMRSRPMRTLGKYSYALYLFQAPVDHLLTRFGAGPDAVGRLAYFPLGVGVTFALAYASWHLWERHWLQLSAPHSRSPELIPVP